MEFKFRAFNPATQDMLYSFEAPEEPSQLGAFFMGISLVPESIVMQSTTLKDKKKVEIYAGDYLKMETGKIGVVGWSEKFASFIITRDDWAFAHWFGESCNPEDCEVVGNIHQHKVTIIALNDERSVATVASSEIEDSATKG